MTNSLLDDAWRHAFEVICLAYPAWKGGQKTLGVWRMALADLTTEELAKGVEVMIRTCKGFPSAADIYEGARGKPTRVPKYVEDNWGNRLLDSGGKPVVEKWEDARREVDPGGAPTPISALIAENPMLQLEEEKS